MSLSKVSEVLFIHGKFTKIGYNRKVGKMTEYIYENINDVNYFKSS